MNISADRARLESGKKLLSLSLENPAKDGGGGRNRPFRLDFRVKIARFYGLFKYYPPTIPDHPFTLNR